MSDYNDYLESRNYPKEWLRSKEDAIEAQNIDMAMRKRIRKVLDTEKLKEHEA